MAWPDILEHPFVAGHIHILPEDVQSESPFTQPLTHSQQEAKQLQRDKISSNARYSKDNFKKYAIIKSSINVIIIHFDKVLHF